MRHRCSSPRCCCERLDARKAWTLSTCRRFAFSIRMATSFAGSKIQARRSASMPWPCYHTDLYSFQLAGLKATGIIGCVVGAPFAVLVAEELFACGCKVLISLTSAGQIVPAGGGRPILLSLTVRCAMKEPAITNVRCLIGLCRSRSELSSAPVMGCAEGTPAFPSLCRFEPDDRCAFPRNGRGRIRGCALQKACWQSKWRLRRSTHLGAKHNRSVLCLAQVTNTMGLAGQDFEKGEAQGAADALMFLEKVASALFGASNPPPATKLERPRGQARG